jgi:signal transduction histidine kinase
VSEIREVDPLQPALPALGRTGDEDLDAIPDAINSLIRELDHVLKRERAFADAASHELRTPLAVIRGAIDVLRERGDCPAHVLDRMDRAAHRVEEDLRALLALSPARRPASPRLADLREILPAAAEPYLREGSAKTRVAWEWGPDSRAWVEPATLAIVFTNLLRNALRATPQGEIRILAAPSCVQILDDGEGLPDGWPATGEPQGSGLGLSLARILAERNGWELHIGRAEPHGTRASLFLGTDRRGAN